MSEKVDSVKRCIKRKKQIAVDRMGGKCSKCGYSKCLSAIEFHHIDKSKKKEKPSHVILNWSWERAMEELDKCIIVCSNCHREIHDKENGIPLEKLRINYKKWIEKECLQCKKKFQTKVYEQVFCSNNCRSVNSRAVVRPGRRDMERLIKSRVTWTQMGKMFGVSDNAVRKWAKNYGLLI